MNRIVKEHYPASRLPEDLRAGMDPESTVTVTIVEEEAMRSGKLMTLDELWAMRTPPFRTAHEIDKDLRRQRDEWDD